MGETANTAKIAELAFEEIFNPFGWKAVGPTNSQWDCLTKHDGKARLTTHPTDAVYVYDDPYRPTRVLVNIDFKSYAKATLERTDLGAAIRSLAYTTDCANKSEQFQQLFYGDESGETVGLLFVYNHDNEYDPKRFRRTLGATPDDARNIAKLRRMFVLGPEEIRYLLAVANDIQLTHSKADVRDFERSFFFPNLIDQAAHSSSALSIEALTGPWQIVKLTGATEDRPDTRLHVYCRGQGASVDEHEYLIDYFFRYQLTEPHTRIFVRFVDPSTNAPAHFEHAKRAYLSRFHDLPEIKARLDRIEYRQVNIVRMIFSTIQLGLEARV